MNLNELKQKIRAFQDKGRELDKAVELLAGLKSDEGAPAHYPVVVLDTWVQCPYGTITTLIQNHVDKLKVEFALMREDLGIEDGD